MPLTRVPRGRGQLKIQTSVCAKGEEEVGALDASKVRQSEQELVESEHALLGPIGQFFDFEHDVFVFTVSLVQQAPEANEQIFVFQRRTQLETLETAFADELGNLETLSVSGRFGRED